MLQIDVVSRRVRATPIAIVVPPRATLVPPSVPWLANQEGKMHSMEGWVYMATRDNIRSGCATLLGMLQDDDTFFLLL